MLRNIFVSYSHCLYGWQDLYRQILAIALHKTKASGFVVSEKKICSMFFPIQKGLMTFEVSQFGPQGIV